MRGKVRISGNKNAILPCLAAALLTQDEVVLKNVPNISDVAISLQILQSLGAKVNFVGTSVRISIPKITQTELPKELVSKLRASVLFIGPLLARAKKAKFSHPGGDIIGKRSIETHIEGFKRLGFKFKQNDREFEGSFSKSQGNVEIFLEEASVTATENLIMAASLREGETTLTNCASEPHIVDLCQMLVKMGAQIEGIGSSSLKVFGKEKLGGCEFEIGPDYVEIATYAIAAAITGGKIELENCSLTGLEPLTLPLGKMGVHFETRTGAVVTWGDNLTSLDKLHTNIWPGFPTDVMSLAIVLATQTKGITLCHDWMYENRMFFVDKLINMGAQIVIADPHRVLVSGPTKLIARDLESPDIRAGMALVLAALIASGTSTINRSELIERGYADVVKNFTDLGAQIERQD